MTMAPDFNFAAQLLTQAVLADHPDWQAHVFPYGPEDDPQAEEGSVKFCIPAPKEPTHRLEIAQRGNTVEIAYDCGSLALRAEAQFIWHNDGDIADAMEGVRAFLSDLIAGRVVVVRESLGKIVRFLRRDGVSELAHFRTADEIAGSPPERYSAIHTWT
jgi:hypothetical protein